MSELQTRSWLLDPGQGGVLLDLMYHYFALSYRLLSQTLHPRAAVMKTPDREGALCDWNENLGVAETFASIEGFSEDGTPFRFEVSKYVSEVTERWFKLHFRDTTALMTFAKENILSIRHGSETCAVRLAEDYYEATVRKFAEYVASGREEPHGMREAEASIKAIEAARNIR